MHDEPEIFTEHHDTLLIKFMTCPMSLHHHKSALNSVSF